MRNLFFAALLACCCLICRGQDNSYRFRFISLPENFKGQFISLVEEDAAGMLWFATNNGLHRYDGTRILTFDMQSSPALPDINIRRMFADTHHNLWIATRNGLLRFDLQQWIMHPISLPGKDFILPQDRLVSAFAEGRDGTVYAGFGNGKLYRLAENQLQLVAGLKNPPGDRSGKPPFIRSIQETTQGEIWLTTEKGQIIVTAHRQNSYGQPKYFEPSELAESAVNLLVFPPSGKGLVYADGKGAFLFDPLKGTVRPLRPPTGLPSFSAKNIYPVRLTEKSVLFFYAGAEPNKAGLAVFHFNNDSLQNISSVYPPSFKGCLFRGLTYKKDQVFIPSNRGIAVASFNQSAVDAYGSSLENLNSIRSLYKAPGSDLLVSSYLHKFGRFNEAANTGVKLSDHLVSCFLPWKGDTLLAGLEGGHLSWYITGRNAFVPVLPVSDSATAPPLNPYVYCLGKENDTTVWVGTYSGVYAVNPYTGKAWSNRQTIENTVLQQSIVYDMLQTGHSRWFATSEGLFKLDHKTGSVSRPLADYGSRYAFVSFSCLRQVANEIWAGTLGNGLLILDTQGKLVRQITVAGGLAGNVVFSNPLCKEYVLVGTGSGLSVVNIRSGAITNYSSAYYLPSDEFNRSAWYVRDDTVYMGTVNGFICVNVNRLAAAQASIRPAICLSGFTLTEDQHSFTDNTLPYHKNPQLTIPPQTSYFSLSFGGLGPMTEGIKLSYRLSSDKPWQSIGQQREITLFNLSPGHFTLQIAAQLPDGKRLENILSVPIDVRPRFYQRLWFRMLLFVTAVLFLWIGMKFRERSLLKEFKLRSRIAGDLHDEVGSTLTRIYFQAGQLSGEMTTGKHNPALQKIAMGTQEALSSISDMVWSIDAHYDNAADLVDRMKDYVARLQDELECRCVFEARGTYSKRTLDQIRRQNIFLIFKEALNNAVKHGCNETINTALLFEENSMQLTIRNNISTAEARANNIQGGNGLHSMQLRATKIRGAISVYKTEQEFVVQLIAPL